MHAFKGVRDDIVQQFVSTRLTMLCRVLRMRMGRERVKECLFDKPGSGQKLYPFGELYRPKPRAEDQPDFEVGLIPPSKWKWEPAFQVALMDRLRELQWMPGKGSVTFIELALDFEAHSGSAMPAAPSAELESIVLSLHEKARVLRTALAVLQKHLRSGTLVPGSMTLKARSLVPLGAGPLAGLTSRLYFTRRSDML